MIITKETLEAFNPCEDAAAEFERLHPDGLDVSGLWGDKETRAEIWQRLLADEFLRRYVGWAIGVGLIPARITGKLADANLHRANLSGANLSGADLRRADLSGANLTDGQREYAEEKGAIL